MAQLSGQLADRFSLVKQNWWLGCHTITFEPTDFFIDSEGRVFLLVLQE